MAFSRSQAFILFGWRLVVMFKVKITARNFTYGAKIYGTTGEYEVDEKTARYIVDSGKGQLIEGKFNDAGLTAHQLNDGQFVAMVRRNARDILKVLETEAQAMRGEELESVEPSSSQGGKSEANETSDDEEETPTDADTASSNNSESTNAEVISDGDGDLPENFPGRAILIAAGINKIADIPADRESLMEIKGVSSRLANQIGIKLSQV